MNEIQETISAAMMIVQLVRDILPHPFIDAETSTEKLVGYAAHVLKQEVDLPPGSVGLATRFIAYVREHADDMVNETESEADARLRLWVEWAKEERARSEEV